MLLIQPGYPGIGWDRGDWDRYAGVWI